MRRRSVTGMARSPLAAPASAAAALPVVLYVPAGGAGRGEIPELVGRHRVGHEHGNVLPAVVDRDRVADHGRHDHGATRPGLDHVVGALVVLGVHLLHQVVVHEGTLLQAARHWSDSSALLAGTTTTDDLLVAGLAAARAALGLAPRADGVTSTGR